MDKRQHIRKTKLQNLQHHTETVAIINPKGEYEIKPPKYCEAGDVVYVIQEDDSFIKTEII